LRRVVEQSDAVLVGHADLPSVNSISIDRM
jgi:hypothetical protein